jgi:hypothetical protein
MRGRDDRAAANQRAMDALVNARRRAVLECQLKVVPETTCGDEVFPDPQHFAVEEAWDYLNVGYLRSEWPPSMLS